MAISKETRDQLINKVAHWCLIHGVSKTAMIELFGNLTEIPGNKSFEQSMQMLYETSKRI